MEIPLRLTLDEEMLSNEMIVLLGVEAKSMSNVLKAVGRNTRIASWIGNKPVRDIRDFRGALVGRAEKGLFVITGTFTREAMREAIRDGATQIDLMDGDQLADNYKELKLGIRMELVKSVDVDSEWFGNI